MILANEMIQSLVVCSIELACSMMLFITLAFLIFFSCQGVPLASLPHYRRKREKKKFVGSFLALHADNDSSEKGLITRRGRLIKSENFLFFFSFFWIRFCRCGVPSSRPHIKLRLCILVYLVYRHDVLVYASLPSTGDTDTYSKTSKLECRPSFFFPSSLLFPLLCKAPFDIQHDPLQGSSSHVTIAKTTPALV